MSVDGDVHLSHRVAVNMMCVDISQEDDHVAVMQGVLVTSILFDECTVEDENPFSRLARTHRLKTEAVGRITHTSSVLDETC